MTAKYDYIPEKQDIIWIDFDPSVGREIQKRRPAIVVSRREYSERTGFVAVCPITHGQSRLEEQGLLVPVRSNNVDGSVEGVNYVEVVKGEACFEFGKTRYPESSLFIYMEDEHLSFAELVKDKDFGFEIVGNVYENLEFLED
ncbi:type II toxin-antitoxin system PemK/MazF family toxin [Streptococcus pneumoniae]|nr:type II toxin-antitoxin system PemK/MazF family toxin [Streptococcus pneumoniae]